MLGEKKKKKDFQGYNVIASILAEIEYFKSQYLTCLL